MSGSHGCRLLRVAKSTPIFSQRLQEISIKVLNHLVQLINMLRHVEITIHSCCGRRMEKTLGLVYFASFFYLYSQFLKLLPN